jgi:hypothetical protein
MYRKVPGDLLEGSQEGSVVSWAALLFITVLVIRETQEFLSPSLVTDLSLDRSQFSKIKVNFDFTLMDLRCEVRNDQYDRYESRGRWQVADYRRSPFPLSLSSITLTPLPSRSLLSTSTL